jgi:predicted acetyltransferase
MIKAELPVHFMEPRLVKYDQINESGYYDFLSEWKHSIEKWTPSAIWVSDFSFAEMMDYWTERETNVAYKKGLVPATLFYLVHGNGKLIGAIDFRHELNNRLLQNGGHIGYGIWPSERNNGYASYMLSLLLKQIKKHGYEKVLITCSDGNLASAKVIEKNNGKLLDKPVFEEELTRRYWIHL